MAAEESAIPGRAANHEDTSLFQISPPAASDPFATTSPAPIRADGIADVVVVADSDPGACRERDMETKRQRNPHPTITDFISSGSALHSPDARARHQQHEAPVVADAQIPVGQMTKSTPIPDHDTGFSSLLSDEARPLRTASVRADTTIVQPIPKPLPIAHPSASSHTTPDKLIRSSSAAGNIAQLEATAERLSMTSSIDDAIRDLHGELKRSDSRRSARLALATMASVDENVTSPPGHLGRHISTGASIVSTNNAARQGGYSPAGFVMSPNTSLTSRLRSGSANSAGRTDATLDSILSRHGPGNSSVRSVRSSKLSLAEISESDPVSLTREAFDEADAAPPLEEQSAGDLQLAQGTTILGLPNADDAFHQMLDHHLSPTSSTHYSTAPVRSTQEQQKTSCHEPSQRPESIHSNNTSEQARDAFVDFDGVHWESQDEDEISYVPEELNSDLPTPRPVPMSVARPTSYIDPSTGTKMLYYPARVPAMLNLPPKLSSKPKAAVRDQRRSQVLGAMMDANTPDLSTSPQRKRQSALANSGLAPSPDAPVRDSWLPDPVANHRNSFAALSSFGALAEAEPSPDLVHHEQAPVAEQEPGAHGDAAAPDHLRRPKRLSKAPLNNRKSMASVLGNLTPQLRASAFFGLPSAAPEVEIKDGSAMATLDSILDASANAPVNAFTDHVFGGKLGSEIYGKPKKQQHRTQPSVATAQALIAEPRGPKKRSSMMWLGKRTSSLEGQERKRPHSSIAITSTKADDALFPGDGRHTSESVNSADKVVQVGAEDEEMDDGEEEGDDGGDEIPDDAYQGPPTTLLAELQLRKQEQKQRVRNLGKGLPNGNYATLLEMDTVAEAQKKNRQNKRVNLAWEDGNAHLDQDGSDDENVPLAIIAAMQRGAKNWADLERPLGLMERREIEDNEPLSRRRARLQGLEMPSPQAPLLNHRQSIMSFSAARGLEAQHPHTEIVTPSPELRGPEVEEIAEETLGNRRRRLATKDGELPKTRPVSVAFSAELLSQFGDAEEPKSKSKDDKKGEKKDTVLNAAGEEETLGQRRRRLQAEREARDREIGFGNSAGDQSQSQQGQDHRRRLSLANILSAHPKRETDTRTHEERLRQDSERRAAQDRESKMTALRMQMPTALPQINIERSGGFLGGAFNDGTGGYGPKAALSSPAVNTHGLSPGNQTSILSGYGVPNFGSPTMGQQAYGAMSGGYGAPNPYGPYNGMSSMSMYDGRPASQMYGSGGGMMPGQTPTKSMDRVEQWRYGVRP